MPTNITSSGTSDLHELCYDGWGWFPLCNEIKSIDWDPKGLLRNIEDCEHDEEG